MPPEIILGRDDDHAQAARELLDLAGKSGRVEVRTGRSGPAFEVDDETYARWGKRHKPSADEQATNAAAADDDGTQVSSDDEIPAAAVTVDQAGGVDVAGDPDGDELPAAAVNVEPPINGDDDQADEQADDEQSAGDPDGDELPAAAVNVEPPINGDDDQADEQADDEQSAPRKTTGRRATTSTRSRSGSGK